VKGDDKLFSSIKPIKTKPLPRTKAGPQPSLGRNTDTPGKGSGGGGGKPVPEPGTMLLVGSGLASMALYGRRRRLKIKRTDDPTG
jgi:hypothetical protein